MSKEIKETIDYINDRIIPNEKWGKIKDYITNSQEENERLRKEKSILEKSLKLIWKKNIKINYEELDKANKIIEKEMIASERD